MFDPVIEGFKKEFDRFHDILVQQIDACPNEEAWVEKTGRFAYWWHILHALAIVEVYALPSDAPSRQTLFPRDVVYSRAEPDRTSTREEIRLLAADIQELAHEFLASQSQQTLTAINENMSKSLGRECSNLNALIGLIRHYSYHIGCVDSLLRARGIPGLL